MAEQEFTTEELQNEIWKPVAEFQGFYEVPSLGRVRNIANRSSTDVGRILKPGPTPNGYVNVVLMRGDRVRYTRSIHRLVATAFYGPSKKQVNHKDGNKSNNRYWNLEYCTPLENKIHARSLGLTPTGQRAGMNTHPECRMYGDDNPSRRLPERLKRGEEHGNATLSDLHVEEIRTALSNGCSGATLARRYGVGKSTISRIRHGKDRFKV